MMCIDERFCYQNHKTCFLMRMNSFQPPYHVQEKPSQIFLLCTPGPSLFLPSPSRKS
jgi:hypothetical protein